VKNVSNIIRRILEIPFIIVTCVLALVPGSLALISVLLFVGGIAIAIVGGLIVLLLAILTCLVVVPSFVITAMLDPDVKF